MVTLSTRGWGAVRGLDGESLMVWKSIIFSSSAGPFQQRSTIHVLLGLYPLFGENVK